MNSFRLLIVASFLTAVLTGCTPAGNESRSTGWPVETFDHVCPRLIMPDEPSCISFASYDGGFKYGGEFNACKQSLLNYVSALDEYHGCTNNRLREIFDELLKSVPTTYNCYIKFFDAGSEGSVSTACPPVEVPSFFPSIHANGLEINFGVPRCIAKSESYDFAPKHSYQLEQCRSDVEKFTGSSFAASSFGVVSAQEQYDLFMRNLSDQLRLKSDDAADNFRCISERELFC